MSQDQSSMFSFLCPSLKSKGRVQKRDNSHVFVRELLRSKSSMYKEFYVKSLSTNVRMCVECRTSASLNPLANTRGIKPVMMQERERE